MYKKQRGTFGVALFFCSLFLSMSSRTLAPLSFPFS